MAFRTLFAIAAGGAVGAVLRHTLNGLILTLSGSTFPLGILTINILGSLFMGILTGLFAHLIEFSQPAKAFLTVGVLGGFTTFSSFSLDAVLLWERGQPSLALLYIALSVGLSIICLWMGISLIR